MALFNFFGGTKNRKFDYIPRYYNPEKEKLENVLDKYQQKDKKDLSNVKMNIQAGLRMRSPAVKSFNIRSSVIFFGVLIVLILITFYLISKYLPLLLGFEG